MGTTRVSMCLDTHDGSIVRIAGSSASGRAANSPNTSFKTMGGFTPLATRMNSLPPGCTTRNAVPSGSSVPTVSANRFSLGVPSANASRYRSSLMPSVEPTSRDTSSSLQPIASSGAIAPIRTCSPPNSITPPTPMLRKAALRVLNTPRPSFSASITSPRSSSGRNGAYSMGFTANASMGIANDALGSSTTSPSASSERVIHRVSPATTTVDSRPSRVRAFARTSAGNPPDIHAR